MKDKLKELWSELTSVLSGSTLDALLPPVVFVVVNGIWGLGIAVVVAVSLAAGLAIVRLLRKQPWFYALGGLLGVGLAAGLAYLTQNAVNYFLPAIAGSVLFLVIALVSLVVGKPLAAWASHLTRGWPLDWFWREDIKPAYREVTWIWAAFFALRLALQLVLFQSGETAALAWANVLLGWPVTILILLISYLYGIWRLKKLGGPGVDEFETGKEPPWDGQTRGF
jgi:hypothetical protein